MKYIILRHVLAGLFSFVAAFYLIPIMSKVATKLGILDYPDGKIKTHDGGVPYLGGLAVYLGFIAGLGLFYPFKNSVLWFLLGITLLLFVGLIDDLIVLSPFKKIIGQLVGTICFLKGGIALKGAFFSGWINTVISGFWLLFVINAFNLVDVMDGLSSLLALVAAIGFFIIAILSANYSLSLLLMVFICPLLAFFYYNKPPARIYLGDSGSLFIGGFLAAVPLLCSWSEWNLYGYIAPVIILGVPLLEAGTLIIVRTLKKIPFYRGSPHHFSIYLRLKGWSSGKILFFSFIISVFLSFIAIFFHQGLMPLWLLAGFLMSGLLFWIKIVFF